MTRTSTVTVRSSTDTDFQPGWWPQAGPQEAFVNCWHISEILFGGARGGGKTDACLGKLGIKALRYGASFNGLKLTA
jgi:hypothetical protein